MDVVLPRGTASVVRRDGADILKAQSVVNDRINDGSPKELGILQDFNLDQAKTNWVNT